MKTKNGFKVSGNIVDVVNKRIFSGIISVEKGKIKSIIPSNRCDAQYITPGLIDSHVHIESSMLNPSEFARLAVVHGTVATVSDPHEIANVLGIEGVNYMIRNGNKVPFKFFFGAPSCVPATSFETSGATITSSDVSDLLKRDDVYYLSEMMNFPGVLFNDHEVMAKIEAAKRFNKPIDGHASGLMGNDIRKYIEAGISTDHECYTIDEALDKLKWGMKILIREGSAAKNFDELIDLIKDYPDKVLFCSDDKHPNDLVKGHINELVKRAVGKGYDPLQVLRSASLNPIIHYNLDVGLLRPGDDADFIIVDNLADFNVLETYVKGIQVAKNGRTLIESIEEETPNFFCAKKINESNIRVQTTKEKIKVIQVFDGQLITKEIVVNPKVSDGSIVSNIENDILKLVVYNRYQPAQPSVAFVNSFNLKKGAIASTVAHDSHNIIALGVNDSDIIRAVNLLIESRGGICFVDGAKEELLPLPVAGLMASEDGYKIAAAYEKLDRLAKENGSTLASPFMTLSFMALLVIPELKLSDKGLFDSKKFAFTSLACD
jgi:adenine deaminase